MIEWTIIQNDQLNPGTTDFSYVKFLGQDSFKYHVISFVKYLTLLRFNLFKIYINKLINSVSLKKKKFFKQTKVKGKLTVRANKKTVLHSRKQILNQIQVMFYLDLNSVLSIIDKIFTISVISLHAYVKSVTLHVLNNFYIPQ